MEQLPLRLPRRIPYLGELFHIHEGVQAARDHVMARIDSPSFCLIWIHGTSRVGKTHFALHLAQELVKSRAYPRLVDNESFLQFSSTELFVQTSAVGSGKKEVLIVDDADKYLVSLKPGGSGPFVHVIEAYRARQGMVILFSSNSYKGLPCDEHVVSRLKEAFALSLNHPHREDIPILLELLARQRGIALSEKKVSFLATRAQSSCKDLEEIVERADDLEELTRQGFKFSLLGDALLKNS